LKPERWSRVEQLLQAVLDLGERQRGEFLQQTCAEDEDLRREVESLLAFRNDVEKFMETPALEVAAEALASKNPPCQGLEETEERGLEGETVSHYEVLEKLGGGGMGVVYKARDTKLGRLVALKFLPSGLSHDHQAIERFRREAYAASALNHPNICTIYDIDEYHGEPFIAMEFLSGQTLKRYIADRPLPLDRILDLAIQISRGLEAAHRQGIIHRDIKPANVFLSDGGTAKILDFGLAKLVRGATETAVVAAIPLCVALQDSVSSPGALMGTLMYMSPEQLRGEELDPRTDLFSFSVLLYEMATAVPPFSGATANAIKDEILHRTPADAEQLNPRLPTELGRIIRKGLEKNRDQRYQNASELRTDLQRLKREAESDQMGVEASPSLLLWAFVKAGRKWMLLSAAVLVLTILAATFLAHRRKSVILGGTDWVLVSDFANTTGEPVFDDTLKQAISVHLAQSPFLNILSDARIRTVLKLMAKPRDTKLTPDIARDLGQRAGAKAYIAGSIASLGKQYVIGLSAINCQTGDLMAQEQETADGKEQVLKALGAAATRLRGRLGESLSTVQKFDTPLDQVTTSSLEALKAVTVGRKTLLEKGDAAAIPFFKHAIELDPNFADAYAALAISYTNLREPGLASENLQKAYDRRDRVSEREKFRVSNYYYLLVTGQLDKAIESNELWAQAYPRDYVPHGNLSTTYSYLGQYESAVSEVLEDLRLNPENGMAYTNLVDLYTALNRLNDAKATYVEALAHKLGSPFLHANRYGVAFLEGDTTEMEHQVAWAEGTARAADVFFSFESDTEAFHGRLGAARELSQRAVESARHNGDPETAAQWQMNSALREAEFGNVERARVQTASALALAPSRDVQLLAALAFARTGDSAQAHQLAEDLARRFPLNTVIDRYWLPTINASIEINRRNPARAVELLQSAAQYEYGNPPPQFEVGGSLYPAYVRGQANLLLHQNAQGIAEFQKFIDHRGVAVNCPLGPLARLGLARAYAVAGDKDKSLAKYREFLAFWKNADSDLRILQEATAEYAKLSNSMH
jgi:eukaryotic-like serine/threonine-protein kinase